MERLEELLSAVNNSSAANRTMLEWLKSLVVDIESHQSKVIASKTTAAAVGVVSTLLLFTPLAPLGIAGVVASGVTGVGASIGDIVKTKSAASQITSKLKEMKEAEKRLTELLTDLGGDTLKMAKELGVSNEIATGMLLGLNSANITGGILATAGAGLATSAELVITSVSAGKTAVDLGRISIASIETAASLSEVGIGGMGVASGAARVGFGAVGVVGGVLAGVGAVIGVADAAWSWTHSNPNIESANNLIMKIVDAGTQLDLMKSSLENIRKCGENGATSSKCPPPSAGGEAHTSSSGGTKAAGGTSSSSGGNMGSGGSGGGGGGPPNRWRTNREIINEIKRKVKPKKSDNVGPHRNMRNLSDGQRIQSNHIPPNSTLGHCSPPIGQHDGIAHSVGNFSHQQEMCYGTTGSLAFVQEYRQMMANLNASEHMGGAIVAQLIVDYALSNSLQEFTPEQGRELCEDYQREVGSRRTLRFRARSTGPQPSLFIQLIDELRAIPVEWMENDSGAFSEADYDFILAFIEIMEERWNQFVEHFAQGALNNDDVVANASHHWNDYVFDIWENMGNYDMLSNYETFLLNIPPIPTFK